MRHLMGVVLAIVMAAAVFFAASWGYLKLLIGPEHGARNVTQFVGFIERSMAPPHTHTYEEAIYILAGEGIVHIGDDRREDIGPGTSIFLPPGTPHCLENRSQRTLKLLGADYDRASVQRAESCAKSFTSSGSVRNPTRASRTHSLIAS